VIVAVQFWADTMNVSAAGASVASKEMVIVEAEKGNMTRIGTDNENIGLVIRLTVDGEWCGVLKNELDFGIHCLYV
jgi:hypothetical protein